MSPQTAAIVFAIGILILFALDRDLKARVSSALWIPVIWLSIGGSRMVSEWLEMAPHVSPDQIIEGSPLDRNLLMGLLVMGIIVLLRRRQKVGMLLQANGVILVFLLYCGASALWSDYPFSAFKRWVKFCGDLVMVLIVLTEPDRLAALKRLLARLGFLLIPMSILLIKYYPDLGRGYENWTWEPVVWGVTTGKNLLGMICMICGLGAVWRLLLAFRNRPETRGTGPIIAQGIILVMVLWLFSEANAMTSLLCFVLACTIMVALRFRWFAQRPWLVHFLVVAVLSVSISILFLGIGESVLSAVGRDPTLTGRTDVWNVALSFAGSPLFGVGFESFWLGERLQSIWDTFWWNPNGAHNGYLELYLNLGWVGVALFALVMVTGYRNIIDALHRDPDAGTFRLAFFVAVMVYNFTEAVIRGFQPSWVLFLLTIIAVPRELERVGQPVKRHASGSYRSKSPKDPRHSTPGPADQHALPPITHSGTIHKASHQPTRRKADP